MPAWIYRKDDGYFVGEGLGIVFYESSVGIDLSEEERPVEFDNIEQAKEYMDSWVVSDGEAFVTTTPPGQSDPISIYRGIAKPMPKAWLE